jgi:hypothetical protein
MKLQGATDHALSWGSNFEIDLWPAFYPDCGMISERFLAPLSESLAPETWLSNGRGKHSVNKRQTRVIDDPTTLCCPLCEGN